jgi:threonine dehydrogenase-like Zn-dependent dehydrogenase
VYQAAVNLMAGGRIQTAPMVTHRFEFPRVEEALRFSAENKQISLKTMVVFD